MEKLNLPFLYIFLIHAYGKWKYIEMKIHCRVKDRVHMLHLQFTFEYRM